MGNPKKRVPRSCRLRKCEKKQKWQKTFKVLSRSAFWVVAPKGSWTYAFKNREDFSFFTFSFSDHP